jgi:hypothetical protein
MGFVWFSEYQMIISLNNNNQLILVMVMSCFFFEERTVFYMYELRS